MNLIEQAKQFAHNAHDLCQQKRKYTGEPYWTHTDAVAEIVAAYGGTETMIAAAHLHDILEDTEIQYPELVQRFRYTVADLVDELTDKFTKEAYPKMNRESRKTYEAARLAIVSDEAKTIKLADLYDNTKSIVAHDPNFAKTYLREKEQMLKGLFAVSNPELFIEVKSQLIAEKAKLGLS